MDKHRCDCNEPTIVVPDVMEQSGYTYLAAAAWVCSKVDYRNCGYRHVEVLAQTPWHGERQHALLLAAHLIAKRDETE